MFIVQTDKYAGNFEREMCAYMTGQYGECEVGDREADEFTESEGDDLKKLFETFILQVPDEHAIERPVEISNIHDDGHKSFAIFFSKIPPRKLVKIMKHRGDEYAEEHNFNVLGYSLYLERKIVERIELELDKDE
jgi:hypothetical protein